MSDGFETVRRRKKAVIDDDEKLRQRFTKLYEVISESLLFKEVLASLDESEVKCVRCLALGSPSQSVSALYQLCLLKYLEKSIDSIDRVSLWDPVFTDLDKSFLTAEFGYKVEETFSTEVHTLYYMPHAERDHTEQLLKKEKPLLILGNSFIKQTFSKTDAELYKSYRRSAIVANLVSSKTSTEQKDSFQVAKRGRRRKGKHIPTLKELITEEDRQAQYFVDATETEYSINEEDPWCNSFRDMALTTLAKR